MKSKIYIYDFDPSSIEVVLLFALLLGAATCLLFCGITLLHYSTKREMGWFRANVVPSSCLVLALVTYCAALSRAPFGESLHFTQVVVLALAVVAGGFVGWLFTPKE